MSAEESVTPKKQGERNVGASVLQRLRNRAKANREDVGLTLIRYVCERFLYRLSQSPHSERFVLKGATLFAVWQDKPYRATGDLDFLGIGDSTPESMRRIIEEIVTITCHSDGVTFLLPTLTVETRPEGRVYNGLHVEITAALASSRPRVEIDIAFGEIVTPAPQEEQVPAMLPDLPAPVLRVYPRETVIAEKCQAAVMLGIGNTRMKDFYDLWYLSRTFTFDGQTLVHALQATFARRNTPLPADGAPLAFTAAFSDDAVKARQWQRFLAKSDIEQNAISLAEVTEQIRWFLQPCLIAANASTPFNAQWKAGGPWREMSPP